MDKTNLIVESYNEEISKSSLNKRVSIITRISNTSNVNVNEDNLLKYTFINVLSSTICVVSIFLIETINISFVGHIADSETNISAVGIGNVLVNFTSMFIVFGSLGAMDTVGSYLFGRKDITGLKIYTIRMRIIIMFCFIFFALPACLFSKSILLIAHQTEEVADKASIYTKCMLPAILFSFNFNLNVRYLQILQRYYVISGISVITVVLHYLLNYISYNYYDQDFNYIAYNSCLSLFIAYLLSALYAGFIIPEKYRMVYFHRGIFILNEFKYFIKLSFFSAVQHYGDYIGLEVIGIFGSFLNDKIANAASLIVLNFSSISGHIYTGSSYPLAQIVSYSLGKEDYNFYKYVIKVYAILNLCISLVLTSLIIFGRFVILDFYTSKEEITPYASPIFIFYGFVVIIDTYNVMMQGILRGTGNQHIPSIWNVICTIFVTLPVGYVLSFVFDFGIFGLWIGCFCFIFVMMIINLVYVVRIDFNYECEKIKKELIQEETLLVDDEFAKGRITNYNSSE